MESGPSQRWRRSRVGKNLQESVIGGGWRDIWRNRDAGRSIFSEYPCRDSAVPGGRGGKTLSDQRELKRVKNLPGLLAQDPLAGSGGAAWKIRKGVRMA